MGYWQSGALDWGLATLALAAAVLMQLITNLQNDVGFTTRGAQHVGSHTGLPRATAMGWLSTHQVRVAILILSVLASGPSPSAFGPWHWWRYGAGPFWPWALRLCSRRWPIWVGRAPLPIPPLGS